MRADVGSSVTACSTYCLLFCDVYTVQHKLDEFVLFIDEASFPTGRMVTADINIMGLSRRG